MASSEGEVSAWYLELTRYKCVGCQTWRREGVLPAPNKAKTTGSGIQCPPGIQSKIKASLVNIRRACLKIQRKKGLGV